MNPQPKCRAVSTETPGRFRYQCGATTDGRHFLPVGCEHATPRESVDHVEKVWPVAFTGQDANGALRSSTITPERDDEWSDLPWSAS